jgi:hypothetical protein
MEPVPKKLHTLEKEWEHIQRTIPSSLSSVSGEQHILAYRNFAQHFKSAHTTWKAKHAEYQRILDDAPTPESADSGADLDDTETAHTTMSELWAKMNEWKSALQTADAEDIDTLVQQWQLYQEAHGCLVYLLQKDLRIDDGSRQLA